MENNIKHIDEAMYELGADKVIKKKKSVIPGLLTLVAGGAMVAAALMPSIKDTENLSFGLLFMGAIFAMTGLVLLVLVLAGSGGRPYYVPTKEFLKRIEMYYDGQLLGKVRECVGKGDFARLAEIDGGMGTGVMVVMYRGKKTGTTFCQVFDYIPHNYEPADEMLAFGKNGSDYVLV